MLQRYRVFVPLYENEILTTSEFEAEQLALEAIACRMHIQVIEDEDELPG